QTITANLNFRAKLDLLGAIFQLLPMLEIPADVAGLQDVLAKAQDASEVRNDVLHSLSWVPEDKRANLRATRKKGHFWREGEASVEALNAAADEILAAAKALESFMFDHFKPYG